MGKNKAAKLRQTEKRVLERVEVEAPYLTKKDRIAAELSVSGHGYTQSSQALSPLILPLPSSSPLPHSSSDSSNMKNRTSPPPEAPTTSVPEQEDNPSDASAKPSQTTSLINEFEACIPELMDLFFNAQIRTEGLMELCACSRAKRTVTCFDCTQCPLVCEQCFITSHKQHPLHWAERWSSELSCFVRHDISSLSPLFAVHLGHSGDQCPSSSVDQSGNAIDMTLVALNGIHRTRVRFCTCNGIPSRVNQLMSAGFFPASVKLPRTAFAFEVLDHFQRLQLECKSSAYDFCSCLRRATDDAFTSKVPDIHPQFIVAMQIWRVMVALKRLGQDHGIDDVLPHRRSGNLIVHCPVCPEPHVNLGNAWRDIPDLLKHLCQLQLTADGNHQLNRYLKNTDIFSRSLFAGRAQFPTDLVLQGHLQPTKGDVAEKSTCNHLNAAEKQDRKKFKNMDITGIVNIQCSHVFVKSSVDLQLGEKFTNTDLAYALTLGLHQCLDISDVSLRHITARDLILSYDIACGYLVKLLERFSTSFPHLVSAASRTRGMIPAVHIQNHQDNCMYMYSGAYLANAGHFHGETAEQYWVESNQLGGSVRQMNNGQRQDVIIDHHNWWNWEKSKQMADTLEAEVTHARDTYQQHKHRFRSLCTLHSDKLEGWNRRNRTEWKKQGKEVVSVYRYSVTSKVPSQKSILEALLQKQSRSPRESRSSTKSNGLTEAEFLDEGLAIQAAQRQLSRNMAACETHSTATSEREVKQEMKKLQQRLEGWRVQQQDYMPQVSADVLRQVAEQPCASKERLFLPSDYDTVQRTKFQLGRLASLESELREGFAFDTITSIQQYVKCLEALKFDKRANCKGQDQNTRANTQIARIVSDRKLWISHYNANREALISLDYPHTSRSFPRMTVEDTQRTSVTAKRVLGASRQFDGKLWSASPTTFASSSMSSPRIYAPIPLNDEISTQGAHKISKTLKRKATQDSIHTSPNAAPTTLDDARKAMNLSDGWIWRLGSIGNLTSKEIEEWEAEGDRVHWFRAEAEMERWREQWEIKLAEFVRCIKSFSTLAETWSTLADNSRTRAREVYARKKSAVYRQLCFEVESAFASIQEGEPTEYRREEDVVEYIIRHRKTEVGTFHPKYSVQLFRVFK